MKVKTSELTGAALDWAVAKCEGWNSYDIHTNGNFELENTVTGDCLWLRCFQPSTDWAQGGPIIERENISVQARDGVWSASMKMPDGSWPIWGYGPSPLIAAMRCYVASKLGDEVEVPEELIK